MNRKSAILLICICVVTLCGVAFAVTNVKHGSLMNASGDTTIDMADANPFKQVHLHLTSNATLYATNVTIDHVLFLAVHQHAMNSYTLTWDTNMFIFGDAGLPTNTIPAKSRDNFIFGGGANGNLFEFSRSIDVSK